MNLSFRILVVQLLAAACLAPPVSQGAPEPTAPADGSTTIVFHPTLAWSGPFETDLSVDVEIATDSRFAAVIDADRVHSISGWYVPASPLAPGKYWWRARHVREKEQPGDWSAARSFTVAEPAESFSIDPGTTLQEIREIATAAARAESARIVFAPGDYVVKPGPQQALLNWKGEENLIVDGGGARFVLADPSSQLWKLDGCRNVLIGNFSVEYAARPHTIAEVVSTDPKKGVLEAGYVDGFGEARYPRVVNQMFCYVLDPRDPRRLHPDRPGHLYLDPERTEGDERGGRVSRGGGHAPAVAMHLRLLRYFVRDEGEFGLLEAFRPGDRMVVCYRRWPLSYVQRSTDVTLHHITLRRSEAPYFMGGGNEEMKFLSLQAPSESGIYPSPPGWVSGNDRRGPWIEGCFFEAIADDGPNITGNAYSIERIEGRSISLRAHIPWQNGVWRAGDRLVFWNPVTGFPVQSVEIAEVGTPSTELAAGLQQIVLSADPDPSLVPGPDIAKDTHAYNDSCQNEGFVARHNRLVGGRRFGFIVRANRALIEHNHFEGLSSSAVYLENSPTFWEGLACNGAVIQSNSVMGCGDSIDSARRRRASGVFANLWKFPAQGSYDTAWQGHRNLLIRGNQITDWESAAIAVDNVQGARIEGNTIANRDKSDFLIGDNAAILVGVDATDVVLGENEFKDTREYLQQQTAPLVEVPPVKSGSIPPEPASSQSQ